MLLWLNVWNKELLTLRNFFVVTKKFLKAKFDCNTFCNYLNLGIQFGNFSLKPLLVFISFLRHYSSLIGFLKQFGNPENLKEQLIRCLKDVIIWFETFTVYLVASSKVWIICFCVWFQPFLSLKFQALEGLKFQNKQTLKQMIQTKVFFSLHFRYVFFGENYYT